MTSHRPLRIAPRLLRIVIPVVLVLAAFGAAMAWREYRDARASAAQELQSDAAATARRLDRFLQDRFELLAALGSGTEYATADSPAIVRHLAAVDVNARGFNGGMAWFDRAAVIRATSAGAQDLGAAIDRPRSVRSVLRTRIPAVQVVHDGRLGRPMVLIAVPTQDARGAMNGVIVGRVQLDQMRSLLPGINVRLSAVSVADDADHLLIGGSIDRLSPVARSAPLAQMVAQRSGWTSGVSDLRGNDDMLIGFASVPRAQWLVTVAEPRGPLLASARRSLRIQLALVGLLVAGSIGVALFEARRAMRARQEAHRRRLRTARLRIAAAKLSSASEREAVGTTMADAICDELDAPWCAVLDVTEPDTAVMIARVGHAPPAVADLKIDPMGLHRFTNPEGVNLTALDGYAVVDSDQRLMGVPVGSRHDGLVAVMPLSGGRTLLEGERAAVAEIVESAGQAFARARLIDQDRRIRRRDRMLAALEGELLNAQGVSARARRLVELLVPTYADFAGVIAHGKSVELIAVRHRIPGRLGALSEALGNLRIAPIQTPRSLEAGTLPSMPSSSAAQVSLRTDHRPLSLVIGREHDGPRPALSEGDLSFVDAMALRAGVAITRAHREEQDRHIGLELQRSLIRELPSQLGSISIASRYLPGSPELKVGGDWFDAFQVPDGRIAMCVGDVVGHGLAAATAMGRLSSALRAMALVDPDPDAVLNNLEVFAFDTDGARLATVAYVLIEPQTRRARYRLAGHPPPLVLSPQREPTYLWDGRAAPLGVLGDEDRRAGQITLAPGTTVLLFSDGLFERRREMLDESLTRLADLAAPLTELPVARVLDRLIQSSLGDGPQADDVCVVAARLP